MAVNVTCPGCRTSYPVTEDLLGKKIRCKKCQETFTATAAKSAVASRADERITTRKPAKGGNGRYDDDGEDEAPRRNGNGRARPAAKRPAAKANGNGMLIGGIAGGVLLLAAGVGLGVWMLNKDDPGTDNLPVVNNTPAISTGTSVKPPEPAVSPEKAPETPGESTLVTAPAPDAPQDIKIVSKRRPANFTQAVVDRVKKSAVLIRVMEEQGMGYGSGWFAEKHGNEVYIVTNSHVVGMKEPAKPPPEKIEVILNSGMGPALERTLEGKLLALDREEDLAVIRIKGNDLPDPLPIAPSFDLQESEKLVILGFPHGKFLEEELRRGLGVRVTTTLKARQSTVAGRIYNKDNSVRYIQVEGGADPGNSGGAVVDTNGCVSAILVAGDPRSNMRWVIPSEYAIHLLKGRVLNVSPGQAVASGGTIRQPLTAMIADPLRRLRRVEADVWVGRKPDAKKGELTVRPAPDRMPRPQEGDGPRATVGLAYDPDQQVQLGEAHAAHGEVSLPVLKENEVYWFQPHYDSKDGKQRWGEAIVLEMGRYPVDARPAHLAINLKPDMTPGPARRVEIESRQTVGGDVGGNDVGLTASLTEKTRSVEKNGDAKVRIQYLDLHLSNTDDDSQMRKQLRGMMETVKGLGAEVTITKDGRFVNPKPDFANIPQAARPILHRFNDQIIQSLEAMGLTLPGKDMQPGETWVLEAHASLSLGRGSQNMLFHVNCTYTGTRIRDGREEAVVELQGRAVKSDSNSPGGGDGTARGVRPGSPGDSPGNPDDPDSSPYDENGNLKKGYYGILHGAAVVDVATGQVTLARTESDMAGVFTVTMQNPQTGQDVAVKVNVGANLETVLRRSLTKDAPKPADTQVLLPNQPQVYKPMVGAAPAALGTEDAGGGVIEERNTFLESEMFRKVKKATALISVTVADGVEEGTGWFAEPGIVVTNSHVVGMLSKTGRPPEKIEVVLDSGLPTQRKLPGRILTLDREDDLAVIRVEGDNLPEPLKTDTAETLYETQLLSVVGFPKGTSLGHDLGQGLGVRDVKTTVKFRPTTVAGRVPKVDQTIKYIQYEGGSDPGNSGGPVVDAKGNVRCVHVAHAPNERGLNSMRFGIPGEYAGRLIQGYPLEVLPGRAYLDGSVPKQPITVKFGDPLHRVTKVILEYWAGNDGTPRKPSTSAPTPAPGDGARKSIDLKYDPETQSAAGEFVLPDLPSGRVCWLQPRFTNGTGAEQWGRAIKYAPDGPPVDRKPALLAVNYKAGTKRDLELITYTNLHYILFGTEYPLGTPFKVSMSENVLGRNSKTGSATMQLEYQALELDLKKILPILAEEGVPPEIEQMLQARLRPLLSLIRGVLTVVTVYRDGRMKLAAPVNVSRLPVATQGMMLQFNSQVLTSLQALTFPLPGREVPYGHPWDFKTDLFIQSRSKSEGAAFKMHFKYVGVRDRAGRPEAVIEITGSLANNPNAKGIDLGDPNDEPKQSEDPAGDPKSNAAREQYKPPGSDDAVAKKGLFGVAHGYALVDVRDGFVAETKLYIDLDVEVKVKDIQSKQEVPVIAGGTMELHLVRRTAQVAK